MVCYYGLHIILYFYILEASVTICAICGWHLVIQPLIGHSIILKMLLGQFFPYFWEFRTTNVILSRYFIFKYYHSKSKPG